MNTTSWSSAGEAGENVAGRASQDGLSVGLIERNLVGASAATHGHSSSSARGWALPPCCSLVAAAFSRWVLGVVAHGGDPRAFDLRPGIRPTRCGPARPRRRPARRALARGCRPAGRTPPTTSWRSLRSPRRTGARSGPTIPRAARQRGPAAHRRCRYLPKSCCDHATGRSGACRAARRVDRRPSLPERPVARQARVTVIEGEAEVQAAKEVTKELEAAS
jgi:hypothetical protein